MLLLIWYSRIYHEVFQGIPAAGTDLLLQKSTITANWVCAALGWVLRPPKSPALGQILLMVVLCSPVASHSFHFSCNLCLHKCIWAGSSFLINRKLLVKRQPFHFRKESLPSAQTATVLALCLSQDKRCFLNPKLPAASIFSHSRTVTAAIIATMSQVNCPGVSTVTFWT